MSPQEVLPFLALASGFGSGAACAATLLRFIAIRRAVSVQRRTLAIAVGLFMGLVSIVPALVIGGNFGGAIAAAFTTDSSVIPFTVPAGIGFGCFVICFGVSLTSGVAALYLSSHLGKR